MDGVSDLHVNPPDYEGDINMSAALAAAIAANPQLARNAPPRSAPGSAAVLNSYFPRPDSTTTPPGTNVTVAGADHPSSTDAEEQLQRALSSTIPSTRWDRAKSVLAGIVMGVGAGILAAVALGLIVGLAVTPVGWALIGLGALALIYLAVKAHNKGQSIKEVLMGGFLGAIIGAGALMTPGTFVQLLPLIVGGVVSLVFIRSGETRASSSENRASSSENAESHRDSESQSPDVETALLDVRGDGAAGPPSSDVDDGVSRPPRSDVVGGSSGGAAASGEPVNPEDL